MPKKSIFVRPEQPVRYIRPCRTKTSISGEAVAGCMIAGRIGISSLALPKGTFSEDTL